VMPLNPTFPDTAPGNQSGPLTVSVKNAGGLTSGPPTISIAGRDPSNFAIANNTCTAPLLSGAVCQVTLVFAPPMITMVGSKEASFTASASPGGIASTLLLANATYVTVNPPAYDFGNHPVTAAPKSYSFTVTHIGGTGSGHVLIMAMVNGTDAIDFRVINGCTPGLNPGASCQLSVDFNPTNLGAKSAVLDVAAHLSTTGLTAGTDKASMTGNAVP
jgi:hypothetical protein